MNLKRDWFLIYQNEAGGDGAGGGGAAAPAPAPAPAPSPAPAPAPASAIATGGVTTAPLHERIPEKFRVVAEGDKFDLEASTGKMLDAYSALEKRFGSGDLPPESADKYELDGKAIAEDFDMQAFMSDEKTKGFLKAAHAKGMSNAQVQFAVEFALKEFAPQFAADQAVLSSTQCVESLKKEWGEQHTENAAAATRAFNSLPDDLKDIVDKELGNNPAFNKVMALFGREMSEDSAPPNARGQAVGNIDELMASEAYNNPMHPDHEKVSKSVQAHFKSKYPSAA